MSTESSRRGASFFPIGMTNICWKSFSAKNVENNVYQKLDYLDDVIFRVLALGS